MYDLGNSTSYERKADGVSNITAKGEGEREPISRKTMMVREPISWERAVVELSPDSAVLQCDVRIEGNVGSAGFFC